MGPHVGVEVCELVGIFIPFQLSSIYNKSDIGLYRVDGLAIFRNAIGPQAEKIKKHFQNIFRKNNLNIIVKCNLKMVGVTLNPLDGSYKPFHEPNSKISYIHRESNHPPSIIKQLPLCFESLLSKLSSDENVLIQAAFVYQEALKRAGYNHKLSYVRGINIIAIAIIIMIIIIIVAVLMITTIIIRLNLIVMRIVLIIITIIMII